MLTHPIFHLQYTATHCAADNPINPHIPPVSAFLLPRLLFCEKDNERVWRNQTWYRRGDGGGHVMDDEDDTGRVMGDTGRTQRWQKTHGGVMEEVSKEDMECDVGEEKSFL